MVPNRVEWPTIGVACCIAGGLTAVLYWHASIPPPAVVAALALLAAWYNSLQHEVVHGHPTPWRAVNTAIASLPVGLVVPFRWYRSTHLAHHRDEHLTDPTLDPESFYVSAVGWRSRGIARRGLLVVLTTLPGRLLLGPPVLTMRIGAAAVRRLRLQPVATAASAARHLAGIAVVLAVVRASGLELWVYLLGACWLGWSISLVRSFAEHRFVDGGTRSAVVRAGPLASLLFLNNNLHLSHHAQPGVPWYELPEVHARLDADAAAAAGAGLYTSYVDVARRYAVRPFCRPVHPGSGSPAAGGIQLRDLAGRQPD